ncbi:secreted RxLR effector protein 161-like [Lycium barbarum]|uniref:secreted RxLR effector protein 161-like n=1 Tax=Lycium barbarum TaxID=112863 RepID=UPI00293E9E3A|nr:secreted RxLR effector protein 161-like [Lycium barbarum]
MEDVKVIDTPIGTATKLDLDELGSSVELKLYRGMIGSLFYLTASRSDIVFCEGLCARFESNPNESHLKVLQRILRYLKGTSDLGLCYTKGRSFNLVGYADAHYVGYLVDKKSHQEAKLVALSTSEAGYVAAASCCAQLL